MTPCAVQDTGAIELYFYNELTTGERRAVELHLPTCAECREALAELHTIQSVLAARPTVSAPAGGDWTRLMARLDQAIVREPIRLAAVAPVPTPRGRPPVVTMMAMAALLTLVTSSVAYLAVERHRRAAPVAATTDTAPEPAMAAPGHDPGARIERVDAGFAAVSEQHFERSKLVVLGLATRDPHTASPSDWAYERQLAGALLDDTRLYKQAAQARGLGALAGVMSDLELVLLQTSLADQRDADTLDRLQRLIRKRDLVSKMELSQFF